MAISVMCKKSEPGSQYNEYWSKNNGAGMEIWMMTYAEGKVVALREMNGYDDSDFYATYWDDATQTFKESCYATTRGWTYPNSASVDASEELLAKYVEWKNSPTTKVATSYVKPTVSGGNSYATKLGLKVGMKVKVVGGVKVPKGTIGYITEIRNNPYSEINEMVTLQSGDKLYFTYAKNLKEEA